MTINGKIALKTATAAWCRGQYAERLRIGPGFDAALGFNFIQQLISILGWGRVVAVVAIE